MDLRNEILKEHSKKQCNKIVEWIGSDQRKFNELFHLFINGEYRITQRASWPLCYAVAAHPDLIKSHFEILLKNLRKKGLHNSVKRNSIRLLLFVNLPEKYEGIVMETCFKYVEDPVEPVAIKSFAIKVLGQLAKKYPEIIPELLLILEEQLPYQSAAFKSSAESFRKSFISG